MTHKGEHSDVCLFLVSRSLVSYMRYAAENDFPLKHKKSVFSSLDLVSNRPHFKKHEFL